MNFLLGLLFGFLLGERGEKGGGGALPVPGGGTIPNPFPFPIPGTTPTPAPSGTKTPPAGQTNTSLPGIMPGLLPGIIPASFPWGQPAPGGTPPAGGAIPWTTPTTAVPVPAVRTYTLKSGDYGSGLAQRATGNAGRWKELLTANPEMTTYTDSKGQTQIKPWAVGQKIVVPNGWNL